MLYLTHFPLTEVNKQYLILFIEAGSFITEKKQLVFSTNYASKPGFYKVNNSKGVQKCIPTYLKIQIARLVLIVEKCYAYH